MQNEKRRIATSDKQKFIELLARSGPDKIELTSYVRPDVIPQLSDAEELLQGLKLTPDFQNQVEQGTPGFIALVPNMKGFEKALADGLREIAIFTAASEDFTQKNINCSIAESFARFSPVIKAARANNIKIRGYISTVVQCPYAGKISPASVREVALKLQDEGVSEISLGETLGVAGPGEISALLDELLQDLAPSMVAGHFHNTRGTALANVFKSLEYGLTAFDSSAGGLGGCPYAPGAAGNLATEELVYALERSGYNTGVDLPALTAAIAFIKPLLEGTGQQLR